MPSRPHPRWTRRRLIKGSLAAATALPLATLGAERQTLIGIGQIGTEHGHAAGKMQAMRSLNEIWRVAGLVDATDKASGPAYEGVPRLTEAQLLADATVRAVAVETPLADACATAVRALRAGKHVHLDKPGATDHAEFSAMRFDAERRGLLLQMGYMLRHNPGIVFLRRAVREGWLGEIMEVEGLMGKPAGESERAYAANLPGGAMFELGCHLIDVIVDLLGAPAAVHSHRTPTRDDGRPDHQLAVLEYRRATATVRINLADPFGNERRRLSVTGKNGTCEVLPLESGQVSLLLKNSRGGFKPGRQTLRLPREGGRYDGEFIELAAALRDGRPLAWSAAHDVATHRATLLASGIAVPRPGS